MSQRDPLGKVIKIYSPNPAAGIVGALMLFAIGGGVLLYCHFREPYPYKLMLVGAVPIFAAPVVTLMSLLNIGRSLEIRKRGVRLIAGGESTDIDWDDLVEVEVNRTDVQSLGIATIHRQSSDLGPSGLLTARTEFEVILHTRDGQTHRLSRTFLQSVRDVRSMVIQMRTFAGLQS